MAPILEQALWYREMGWAGEVCMCDILRDHRSWPRPKVQRMREMRELEAQEHARLVKEGLIVEKVPTVSSDESWDSRSVTPSFSLPFALSGLWCLGCLVADPLSVSLISRAWWRLPRVKLPLKNLRRRGLRVWRTRSDSQSSVQS